MATATCSRQTSIDHEKRIFHTNYVLDVTTDLLSGSLSKLSGSVANVLVAISIPVLLLWNVKISLRRKLALMGLFSLTVIVMIFSVVRVYFVTSKTQNLDMTWLFFWSNTEMAVCMYCKSMFTLWLRQVLTTYSHHNCLSRVLSPVIPQPKEPQTHQSHDEPV